MWCHFRTKCDLSKSSAHNCVKSVQIWIYLSGYDFLTFKIMQRQFGKALTFEIFSALKFFSFASQVDNLLCSFSQSLF